LPSLKAPLGRKNPALTSENIVQLRVVVVVVVVVVFTTGVVVVVAFRLQLLGAWISRITPSAVAERVADRPLSRRHCVTFVADSV
jgi:hypothetical protein